MAEELLKTEFDAAHLIYNRFKSAIAYKPTLATILSPDVSGCQQWLLHLCGQPSTCCVIPAFASSNPVVHPSRSIYRLKTADR